MPDDLRAVEALVEEVNLKEERRAGKRKRDNDNIPRAGIDLKPQPEEIIIPEAEVPVEETKHD